MATHFVTSHSVIGDKPGARDALWRPTPYVHIRQATLFRNLDRLSAYTAQHDPKLRIVVTVVSGAVPEQVVVDAGSKTLAADRCYLALNSGYGHIMEYPAATNTKLSEEHAQIDISRCTNRPRIGDRLTIIPNHISPFINLQDQIWIETIEGELQPLNIEARGKMT